MNAEIEKLRLRLSEEISLNGKLQSKISTNSELKVIQTLNFATETVIIIVILICVYTKSKKSNQLPPRDKPDIEFVEKIDNT